MRKQKIIWTLLLSMSLPLLAVAQNQQMVSDVDALTLSLRLVKPGISQIASLTKDVPLSPIKGNTPQRTSSTFAPSQVSEWFLPTYARENPANWAPLCHLEADIEKQLPIGIWVNWEDSQLWKDQLQKSASVRVRLLRF